MPTDIVTRRKKFMELAGIRRPIERMGRSGDKRGQDGFVHVGTNSHGHPVAFGRLGEHAEFNQGARGIGKSVALRNNDEVCKFRERRTKKLEVRGLHNLLTANALFQSVEHDANI